MTAEFWQPPWDTLCRKWSSAGYDTLTPDEKVWFNTRSLIDSISNGGLISYYYNSGADTLDDCMLALDELGAAEVRAQVERVNALFGARVPEDLNERNAIIDSWDEDSTEPVLADVDDRLDSMIPALEDALNQFICRTGLAA
ncbi:MAG TPA: DUF4375 domain-containing protein [Longimicrobiaceae bacterium]|nr:DUF4375 domain-containing protein [Longimicrobiaceae bacterium]